MYKHNLLDDPFISVKVANDSTDIESSSLEMLATLENNRSVMSIIFARQFFLNI